jgi:hypothetical protein
MRVPVMGTEEKSRNPKSSYVVIGIIFELSSRHTQHTDRTYRIVAVSPWGGANTAAAVVTKLVILDAGRV